MIGLGILTFVSGGFGGLWLALIGLFVVAAAKAEENGPRVRLALGGRSAGRLMSCPAVTIPATTSVEEAVRSRFLTAKHPAFPVVENGRVVGLLDSGAIERVPPQQRATMSVSEIADRDRGLIVREDQDVAELLERPAFVRVGRNWAEPYTALTEEMDFPVTDVDDAAAPVREFIGDIDAN